MEPQKKYIWALHFAMAGLSEAERRAVMSLALSDVVCAFGQSLGLRSRDTLREIDTALDRARRLLEQAGYFR